MIIYKELKTKEDFLFLKKGDILACEFHRDIHDYPKNIGLTCFSLFKTKKVTTK